MNQNPDNLKVTNHHPRDDAIHFYEDGHKYEIDIDPNTKYTSVTTWNHYHFPKFDAESVIKNMMKGRNWNPTNKYWGMTPEEIKKMWSNNGASVSQSGTDLHADIECFMNNPHLSPNYTHLSLLNEYLQNHNHTNTSVEWQYFIQFVEHHPHLIPYRTEWMIYDEDIKIAGSIDMIYENPDGTLSIYDWKRCKNIIMTSDFKKYALNPLIKHIPDTNYWHYTLQLNTYKRILENKYGKTIKELFLVRLHPDALEKTYELIPLPILETEMTALFSERFTNVSKNITR